MAETILRWGVLGTARIADAIVKGISMSNNSMLVAVASRDGEKAASWAQARDVPHYFGSYDEMLASDLVEAVYIPLPNALHKEWSVRAADARKHVLCEKPVARDAAEVEELIAVSQKNGVRIMEAFMYRFHPQTSRTQQLIRDGAIGETRIIRASFDFYLRRPHDVRWSPELAGGALMDVGCYCVNVCNFVVGISPVAVTASAVWTPGGVDMSLAGTLEYPNGVLGVIDCSFQVGRNMQQHLEVSGTDGLIRVPRAFSKGEEDALIFVDKSDNESEPERISVAGANHYHLMVENFADAVLNGSEPGYTLSESLMNMRVLDALSEAARTGQRVAIRAGL
jgi:D-xylose 1-dehydrogenase (NADP+, D-xylono-1,5-lactone-forming)